MEIDITIKNYRCFPDTNPARLTLRNGFTAFLGSNNSGKSSLLKFFYDFRELFKAGANRNTLHQLLTNRAQINRPQGVFEWAELLCDQNQRDMTFTLGLPSSNKSTRPGVAVPTAVDVTIKRDGSGPFIDLRVESGSVVKTGATVGAIDDNLVLAVEGRPAVYVGDVLDLFSVLADTLYIGPFRNAVNVGTSPGHGYFDIQVGQTFVKVWKDMRDGYSKPRRDDAERVAQAIGHIFDYSQFDIRPSSNSETLQVTLDGKSYDLKDVGSGLTQFILVLATAAMKRPRWILIDEPELNLHASLQIDFLTSLALYSESGVLFATHSYGLARAIGNNIYSLKKRRHGGSDLKTLESMPRISEFLGELGFSAYRELGFDKILLVEGVHDVTMYQQLLRLLNKDHQVVLIPLGGSQLINGDAGGQLNELGRISTNIAAVIDSERDEEGAPLDPSRAAFVECCNKAGIRCHVLQRRAAEHYLSDRAIKKKYGPKYRALGPYEPRENVRPMWGKADNWRIAREMTENDLDGLDIWEFLKGL